MRVLIFSVLFVAFSILSKAQTNNPISWNCNTQECVFIASGVVSFTSSPNPCTQIIPGTLVTTLTFTDGSTQNVVAPSEGIICYGNYDGYCKDQQNALDGSGTFKVIVHKNSCCEKDSKMESDLDLSGTIIRARSTGTCE